MSNVWFCSDLHFGHKNIQKFRNHVRSEDDNRLKIKNDWIDVVTKRDTIYVLGDAAFTTLTVVDFEELPGKKILIRGNHDLLDTQVYLKYFESVYGLLKYKEFWLSHAPIHPNELRGKINIHGHVHYETIPDNRYFNACVENVYRITHRSLINLDELRNYIEDRNRGLRS